MRRPGGYAISVEPDARPQEWDTITCGHCQRIVFVKPGTAATVYLDVEMVRDPLTQQMRPHWHELPGAFCRVCMRPVCLHCHDDGRCTPWERRIAAMEARDRFRRSVGV